MTEENKDVPVVPAEEVTKQEKLSCDCCTHQKRYYTALSILVGAILICGSILFSTHWLIKSFGGGGLSGQQVSSGNTQAAPAAVAAAPAAPGTPVTIAIKNGTPFLGNANAKVTVVEFADYECPFCEQWYQTVMPQIKSQYIDTGKIKFIYQDFAFLGPDSNTAAEASHCAEDQGKFWNYHDYLFNNQGAEGSGWATAVHQKQFAQAVGLDTSQFNSCLDSGKYKQEVLDETAAGRTYGVTGTPTVFINGVAIVGAQPFSQFQSAIDADLK